MGIDPENPIPRLRRRVLLEGLFQLAAALVWLSSRGRWRAWPRNSLALGYWSAHSDLDLTLYSAHDAPLPRATRGLARIFRFSGEWAAYAKSDRALLPCANPYERARDPRLQAALGSEEPIPSAAEAYAFWLRLTESDAHLHSADAWARASRRRKWEFHRKQVLGKENSSPFPEFVEQVSATLALQAGVKEKGLPALRPHAWLGPARMRGEAKPGLFASLDGASLAVARAQARWEIWGLLGQVRLNQNFSQVAAHLAHLAEVFPSADPFHADASQIRDRLHELARAHASAAPH